MAVTITKKFWNGAEYKSISKIVFTSPNFTSPSVAGTRSHMPPGGIYMGTWFEAVDWLYRQKPNQNYANLPDEMESFFGKMYVTEMFDFKHDTVISGYHMYGPDYIFKQDTVSDGLNFTELNEVSRDWRGIVSAPNGNVYACVDSGNIYKQSSGLGSFVSLAQTVRVWYGMTASPNGDVYACENPGNIYKQTGGTGVFTSLAQTSSAWYGMASAANNNIYATVYAGNIYKQTGGVGNFVSLAQTVRNWTGITVAPNGNVYACVYNGDIYMQTAGVGAFVSTGQTPRQWCGITATPSGDIYATITYGDIYKQVGGKGSFVAIGQTYRYWRGISSTSDGSIYACSNGDIYKKDSGGEYFNVLYKDKNNYGIIGVDSVVSGTGNTGDITSVEITFSDTVGSGIINEWMLYTTSGTINTTVSGTACPVGEITTIGPISEYITVIANNPENTSFSGTINSEGIVGTLSGTNEETVTGVFDGGLYADFSETVIANGLDTTIGTTISSPFKIRMTGHNYGTVTGTLDTYFYDTVGGPGDTVTTTVSGLVTTTTTGSREVVLSGMVSGDILGTLVSGTGTTVSSTLSGTVSGLLVGDDSDSQVNSLVSGDVLLYIYGNESLTASGTGSCNVSGSVCGPISGVLSSTVSGGYTEPLEVIYHQYSNIAVNEHTYLPKPRWHHGGNSIIFTVTFGEAYDCRLTAWDDDTHSTTLNKVINEEHYRVDAVAYRSNLPNTAHSPVFRTESNLVFPPVYDIPLKGNEKYYGDFNLIFAIETDNYGEYISFIPRLINMDNSFIAGSYDFITTLHYQYT